MADFVGRKQDLRWLDEQLEQVASTGRGRFVSMRGRRRVGKSRLVEEFLFRSGTPHVFFAASRQHPERELALFAEEVGESSLPAAGLARGGLSFDSWDGALGLLSSTMEGSPAVVVLDEFPYLVEQDPSIEGVLQKVWDRSFSRVPILLILVGSDISMMEALTEYDRPLYGRPTSEMVVRPFDPAQTAEMTGMGAADAMEAQLVTGGFPLILQSWRSGEDLWGFLGRELANPTSPLIVSGERMLNAEFPTEAQARRVLVTIGAGERTFSTIGSRASVAQAPLARSLEMLVERKRVVAVQRPLSSRSSNDTLYHVADPYLRFWLRFVEPGLQEIERGRGRVVAEKIKQNWAEYRGRAIEPLVREALELLLPDERFGGARYVGGYWNRRGDVEVDLVGAAKKDRPDRVDFIGSIKWRDRRPFDRKDFTGLSGQIGDVPGADGSTLLAGVSRTGFDAHALDIALSPEDLVGAWRRQA